jgi:hypothetical protein
MADYDRQYIKKQIASAVPATPTAGSLQDILSKAAGGNTFDKATDSLEMLSDKVGAYAGTSGAGATESIKAELDLVKAKTDLITAGAVSVSGVGTTTTGVIVQDGATGTPNVVAVATDASANTFGAWVELDASTAAISYISHITVNCGISKSAFFCVEIGTGAGGGEAAKIRVSYSHTYATAVGAMNAVVFALPIPIKVAASTRIAARASNSKGDGALTLNVGISYYTTLES